jgi:hypothetical protein
MAPGQDGPSAAPAPERSAEVRRALSLVEQYITSETADVTERIDSRREMLEFKFKATGENGRYQLMGEESWRSWERDRSGEREVKRLSLLGDPQVERIDDNLYQIDCAIYLEAIEDGRSWQGVSIRSFEVRLDREGAPHIRHEKALASREGVLPGGWKRFKKTENGTRSNLRGGPTSSRNNVIGKVESGEAMQVWDQEEESWLLARTEAGRIGFLHRSQIDFDNPLPTRPDDLKLSSSATTSATSASGPPKQYPFATSLPGRPGYVLNPYTNTIVDVRELRAGTLVRDPHDPVANRAFRVPLTGTASRAVIVEE